MFFIKIGYGFLPVARLARVCGCAHTYDPVLKSWKSETDIFMQTSVANIYTAGDSSGVNGAGLAEVEGRMKCICPDHALFKASRNFAVSSWADFMVAGSITTP